VPIHRINLKGPWEFEWTGPPDTENPPTPRSGRITMPCDWQTLFGEIPGAAIFRRRFHKPTNLGPDERVWLEFQGIGGNAAVALNGTPLGSLNNTTTGRLEMTAALQPFNELTVTLEYAPQRDGTPGGLHAPVVIAIKSP